MIEAVPLPKWKSSVPVNEPVRDLACHERGRSGRRRSDGRRRSGRRRRRRGRSDVGESGSAVCDGGDRVRLDQLGPDPQRRRRVVAERQGDGEHDRRPGRRPGPDAAAPPRTSRAATRSTTDDDADDDRADQDGDPVRVQPVEERALEVVEVEHVAARMADADDGPMTDCALAASRGVRWQPYNECGTGHGTEEAASRRPRSCWPIGDRPNASARRHGPPPNPPGWQSNQPTRRRQLPPPRRPP